MSSTQNQNPIFKYQTALSFRAETEVTLTNLTSQEIMYIKPVSGVTGAWAASISNATLGYMTYNVQATGDVNEVGNWKMWARAVFTDGSEAFGKVDEVYVHPRPWE